MISKSGIHALKAVTELARLPAGEYAGAGDLADQIGAPRNYLSKLLKLLAEQGVLESQKGKGGGFRLAGPAERLSLFTVIEPIDHVARWSGCFLGRSRCSDGNPCAVHRRWASVRDAYLRFLHDTSVADLAAGAALPVAVSV